MIVMLALDHIVISGTNVKQASEQDGKQLSIKAVKGGEHENWGTYNYLAYFSNSCYIEWLGIHDLQRAKQVEIPLIQHLVHTVEAYDKDRKSTRLNSSHVSISYAVFCLKKK